MSTMPDHLDIAGGYIVAVEGSKWPYNAGDVSLIRWGDMELINLATKVCSWIAVRIRNSNTHTHTIAISVS